MIYRRKHKSVHWKKMWKLFSQNYKDTESTKWDALPDWSNPIRKKQTAEQICNYCFRNGYTPNWCHKKMQDQKRVESRLRCPLIGKYSPPKYLVLPTSTIQHDTNKTEISLPSWMMGTVQQKDLVLLRKIVCKMTQTSFTLTNKIFVKATMAWALAWHISPQLTNRTSNCPILVCGTTDASESPFHFCPKHCIYFSIVLSIAFLLLPKPNLTLIPCTLTLIVIWSWKLGSLQKQ